MSETIIGLFDDTFAANRAVDALAREGFHRSTLSVVTRADAPGSVWSPVAVVTEEDQEADNEHVKEAVIEGAVGGAALGGIAGLLAGVVSLAVPGLGPLFVAGPAASVFTSTAAGAAAGAASAGLGAPFLEDFEADEVNLYKKGLANGGVIVAVSTDREDLAKRVLDEAGALATRAQRPEAVAD